MAYRILKLAEVELFFHYKPIYGRWLPTIIDKYPFLPLDDEQHTRALDGKDVWGTIFIRPPKV